VCVCSRPSSLKTIMAAQYRTMNRGGSSIYEEVRKAGFDRKTQFRCSRTSVAGACVAARIIFVSTIFVSYDRITRHTVGQ